MNFLVLCVLVAFSLPGFSQEGDVTRPEDLPQRVHIINSPSAEPAPVNNNQPENRPEAVNPEDDTVDELTRLRVEEAQAAMKAHEASEKMKQKVFNGPEELAKLGYQSLDGAALLDEKVIKIVQKMMDNSPLKGASRKEVVSLMLEKLQGQPGEEFLKNNPRLLYVFADILRDDKAMSSVIEIMSRRSDLKTYFFIWLSLMITGMLIKRFYFKKQKKWSPTRHFLMGVSLSLSITVVSFSIFYNMFEKELSPAGKIIVQHWRKRNLPVEL